MKYFCKATWLFVLAFSAVCLAEEDFETRSVSRVITSGVSFNQQISSSSINNSVTALANGGQFLITKSGRYFLSSDVVANPVVTVPVIYIAVSDVFIDLGGKTLTLTSSCSLHGAVGIKVDPGLRNITICNGTISGANNGNSSGVPFYSGIIVGDPTGVNKAVCANIEFDSVIVTSCARYGIELYNCQNVTAKEVETQGIVDSGLSRMVTQTVQKAGMHMYNCRDAYISDCGFNGTSLVNGFMSGNLAVGLNLDTCRNINCTNITTADNRAFSAGSAVGLRILGTSSCSFEKVRSVSNKTLSQLPGDTICAGVIIEANPTTGLVSSNNTFKECKFNENSVTDLVTTASAYGFRVTQSCNNNYLVDCMAGGNTGWFAVGFSFFGSKNNTLRKCNASGNYVTSNFSYSQVRGYSSEYGIGNSFIECEANGNSVADVTVGGTGSPITDAFKNPCAFGFFLRSERYAVINDCLSASNYGSDTLQQIAYGVGLYGVCFACTLSFNSFNANRSLYNYGVKDFAPNSTTLLRGNVSFAQGQCYSGGQSSIVDVGRHNYMIQYSAVAGTMDVQNLIKEADIANMNAFEAGSTKWFNFSILEGAISESSYDIA